MITVKQTLTGVQNIMPANYVAGVPTNQCWIKKYVWYKMNYTTFENTIRNKSRQYSTVIIALNGALKTSATIMD